MPTASAHRLIALYSALQRPGHRDQALANDCRLASSGFVSVQADVQTLSVRLGVKRVFWACIMLLELAYAGAIGLGALSQVTLHTCWQLAHLP